MSATLREPRKAAARTALGYGAVAALWILLSDEIANRLFSDPATLQVVSMTKGWVFVAVTAVLLYFRIEEQIRRWSDEVDRRVQIEAQLRRITRAVDQGPASVVVTDRHGVIEYVNEKFTRVTGYTREESVGQHVRMLKSGQTDPALYRQMWETILAGGEWRGELLNRKKNGELFWESASMSPVVDDEGQTYSFLAVKEDITERRALEQQLRQSQKLEAIGTLAGGVAHDFNNLLSVILGSATLLRRPGHSPAEQAELAEEIVQAAERGAGLTRQLLIFSRKNAMRREPVDVNALVTNLSVMIGRVLRSNIVLETRCQSRPSFVMADGTCIAGIGTRRTSSGRRRRRNGCSGYVR